MIQSGSLEAKHKESRDGSTLLHSTTHAHRRRQEGINLRTHMHASDIKINGTHYWFHLLLYTGCCEEASAAKGSQVQLMQLCRELHIKSFCDVTVLRGGILLHTRHLAQMRKYIGKLGSW